MVIEGAFSPDYAVPPGETLADLLDERDMTQADLARRLGVSLKHVNQIVKGVASISADVALRLEKVLGISAVFWLNRESLYQADLARQQERRGFEQAVEWAKRFPLAEMRKRGFLPRQARGPDLVAALLKFFGIAGPEQWRDPIVSFRKSQKFESDSCALAAWLRVGELEASEIDSGPFDADRFATALMQIRALTPLEPEEWYPRLRDLCADRGVALVIVETFTGARANGATRWLSPTKALIQLSLRYRWEDIFWFTFFHEAGHLLLHRKKDVFVEPPRRPTEAQADPEWLQLEREADRFAMRLLIPPPHDRRLPEVSLSEIPSFAAELGIAPAILVGRLQHDSLLPYSQGNDLRRRFEFDRETD